MCQECEDAIERGPEPLTAQDKAEMKAAKQRKRAAEIAAGRDPREAGEPDEELGNAPRDNKHNPERSGPAVTTNVSTPDGGTTPNMGDVTSPNEPVTFNR